MTKPVTGIYFHGRPDTDSGGHVIAHRGASQDAPENTLVAFRLAYEQGARWIEFDVSRLGDGTLAIHHDQTLDRCTDRTGPLSQLTSADLAGIDAGSWFGAQFAGEPLATLKQTLDLIDETGFSANLEIKPRGASPEPMARAVAQALDARPWARTNILVSSFDLGVLTALRKLMPDQPLAMIYRNPPADWPEILSTLGASSLHMRYQHLTADILTQARKHGFHIRVFTINDPARIEPFRTTGLAGVITDHPPLFLDNPVWADWAAGWISG